MSPEDPEPPSSPPLAPPPSSSAVIPDTWSGRLDCQSPRPSSRRLGRHSPHPSTRSPAIHPPGHSSRAPNLHPGGDSPQLIFQSHPWGFLQQQVPGHEVAPLVIHSFLPLSRGDMNTMVHPSSTSLIPDSSLMHPQWLMPSHPSPLVPTQAARSAPSISPTYTPSTEANPRSSQPFLPWFPTLPYQINFGEPMDTTPGYRSNESLLAIRDPSQARLASSGRRRPCNPSHDGNEALLRSNTTIHFRPVSQSHVPSLTSRPADSSPVLKRQRISKISETPSRVNGDAAQTSHPGLQVRNPSPLIAQPIPNSDGNYAGNVAVPSPHAIHRAPISKPTEVDLFNLAKALGGERLADLVRKAYKSYIFPEEDTKEGCGESSEQSAESMSG